MPVETTFAELCRRLAELHETLVGLHTTVSEDKPDEHTLADLCDASVLEVLGSVGESMAAAQQAIEAIKAGRDMERARRALVACQTSFQRSHTRFVSDLTSWDLVTDLTQLAARRRRRWRGWVQCVRQPLEKSLHSLLRVNDALFACCLDLAELANPVRTRKLA